MAFQAHAVEDSFESMDRHLGDLMKEMTSRSYYRFSRSVSWQPPVNVYEDARHFYLCVELAGLSKEEIQVDVVGSKILLRGDRPAPPPPKSETACVLRMEIDSGVFERAVELPDTADMQSVAAKLADGFLWITIKKRT